MERGLIIFLFVCSAIYLVESECRPDRKRDSKELCEEWWAEAKIRYTSSRDIKTCIKMIKEKCPDMIDRIETTIRRSYDVNNLNHETWRYQMTAIRQSEVDLPSYYEYKRNKICWDEDGQVSDCEYWWTVAREPNAEDKYKQRCIERILKHCSNMITLVGEFEGECVQKCMGGYRVRTVIYKDDNNMRASYNKNVPIREK